MPQPYTIGRLAAAAGVHVETVRYYQRRGLVPEPPRPVAGVRRYSATDAERLRFIKRAQGLGLSLEEIRKLFGLDRKRACATTRGLAAQRLSVIETKLKDLAILRDALAALIHECDEHGGARCPILTRLSRRDRSRDA